MACGVLVSLDAADAMRLVGLSLLIGLCAGIQSLGRLNEFMEIQHGSAR